MDTYFVFREAFLCGSALCAHLAEFGRSYSREVELRLCCAPFRLTLALQAAHPRMTVLGAVETLAVGLEAVARQLVTTRLEADPALHDTHALHSVRAAVHGRLVVIPTARARSAAWVLARLRGNVHAFRGLVVFAEAAHAVSRVSKVWLLSALRRLAPFHMDVLHSRDLVCSTHACFLLPGPPPQRLASTRFMLTTALGDVYHEIFLVEDTVARSISLEGKTWTNLYANR